jgi:hypothetical protein
MRHKARPKLYLKFRQPDDKQSRYCPAPSGAANATLTDSLERPNGSTLAIKGTDTIVSVHPYEIVSVGVNYDGH